MNLEKKIRIYISVLLLISFFLLLILLGNTVWKNNKKTTEESLSNVSFLIANDSFIQKNLYLRNSQEMKEKVDLIVDSLNDIDMIVISDLTGKRYSHVNPNLIGKYIVGGDEKKVINEGTSYFSKAKGTLGVSLRRFDPIYFEGEQIGFVVVGKLYWKIEDLQKKTIIRLSLLTSFIFLLIYMVTLLLSRSIKNELKGLEPKAIGKLYEENESVFETLKAGIVLINLDGDITKKNQAAHMMEVDKYRESLGESIHSVLEDFNPIYDREIFLGEKRTFISLIPISKKNQIMGIVLTIKDSNMVTKQAEKITGVNLIVDSLRANIHEFKNKLHVILGLLTLNEVEEAMNFIQSIQSNSPITIIDNTSISDPILSGLIMGKINIAKERGVILEVSESSLLLEKHKDIDTQDLVIIIGNLLENAIEASLHSEKKFISLDLSEDDKMISIQVSDMGVPIENLKDIYTRGFSTKGSGRGEGLAIVMERITFYNGDIHLDQLEDKKIFKVVLTKGG